MPLDQSEEVYPYEKNMGFFDHIDELRKRLFRVAVVVLIGTVLGFIYVEELFEISDIVSLHAPVVVGTENTVDRALLKKLGPEGILVSSARAKLVIEEDLYEALKTKEIASAAIDVFWSEPIEATDRWLALPNVICTPHIAGASLDVVSNHCETILNGIDKWLSSNNTVKGPA